MSQRIKFPSGFPEKGIMLSILKKTTEKAWKNGLTSKKIDAWLANFSGELYQKEDEQKIALWLLCNFTYYNEDEYRHLCRIGHNQVIHQLLVDHNYNGDIEKCRNDSCFMAIGNTSSSGHLLSYFYRQEAKLKERNFVTPECIPSEKKIVICMDDMIISGSTASRFVQENKKSFENKNLYFFALISSVEAKKMLETNGFHLVSPIVMDERNRMFTEKSLAFYRFKTIKDVAKELAKHYGVKIKPEYALGYRSGEYAIGLFYNTPNNTLPIFWANDNWTPIFPRKVKYYDEGRYETNMGCFI